MPQDKGKKLVDMLFGQPDQAAFGVFPQMKPRRSKQDPEAAKNVPIDLARGFIAGAAGTPVDLLNLPGAIYSGITGKESYELPYGSEDILRRIPGGSDTPASRAAAGLGTLAGGFYTGPGSGVRAVTSVVGAVPKAARDFAMAAGQPTSNVIKPGKGGNWLNQNVEKQLKPLRRVGVNNIDPAEQITRLEQKYGKEGAEEVLRSGMYPLIKEEAALNNWIDSNLTNYVKKQMATPEDPVRKLAEEGILHRRPYEIADSNSALMHKRLGAGMPVKPMAQTPEGQFWENITDRAIDPFAAGAYKHGSLDESILERNPWLAKTPDETMVYSAKGLSRDLGFDHIIDVLREDLATGRIRPEQLNKVSMEQAVRRTFEYDQELAEKMAKATAAARADLPVYKEYPEGYRWIELNRPGAFAAESEAMGHSVRGYEPPKGHPDWAEGSGEAGSLGYGHGGWEGIKSGQAKVYSLVDPKGQPHVTVETRSNRMSPYDYWFKNKSLDDPEVLEFSDWLKKTQPLEGGLEQWYLRWTEETGRQPAIPPAEITQIKGKQNAAPKEEYLPFVQDFVKGGQWSDVRDFRNTGLRDIEKTPRLAQWLKEKGIEHPRYLTEQEYGALEGDFLLNQLQPPEGMKHGGSVQFTNNPDTMRLELAGGGMVSKAAAEALARLRVLREEAAAVAAQQARYAEEMKNVNTKDMPTFEQWRAQQPIEKASGGQINRLTPQDMLYLYSQPDMAKMTPQQQREALANMGSQELTERMKGKMAEGGEVTIPDMTDGGKVIDGGPFKKGGKVRFTNNPDTMKLELAARK